MLRVSAVELEARVAIVIETSIVPAEGAMTVAALVAAASVVGVVFGMTAVAGCRRVGKRIVYVAVEAGRFLVFADQGEAGRVVIKFDLEPVVRGMAVAALRTKRARVRVVVFVA